MAEIRAGMLNQGLGQFHGGAYYRNSNYHNNNKYQDEVEKVTTASVKVILRTLLQEIFRRKIAKNPTQC